MRPEYLYYGINIEALGEITDEGAIIPEEQHVVHMWEDEEKAWEFADSREGKKTVVLKIAAQNMEEDGFALKKQKMISGGASKSTRSILMKCILSREVPMPFLKLQTYLPIPGTRKICESIGKN